MFPRMIIRLNQLIKSIFFIVFLHVYYSIGEFYYNIGSIRENIHSGDETNSPKSVQIVTVMINDCLSDNRIGGEFYG